MLKQKKTSKKRLIIYAIIILAMIAGNVFIYYRNSSPSLEPSALDDIAMDDEMIISDVPDQPVGPSPDKTKQGSILDHPLFLTLKKIGDWPVIPKDVGRADPFAPVVPEPSSENN